jgi:hypothetical protein
MSALLLKVMLGRRASRQGEVKGGFDDRMPGSAWKGSFWAKREKERIDLFMNPVAAIPVISRPACRSLAYKIKVKVTAFCSEGGKLGAAIDSALRMIVNFTAAWV